ncbi:MBL fold metallo-hydrolase [Lampropedia puyangensis]|uniref:MBL fold metallo-hydrolase n=2 Tax=Lampropedia puyangensis TaxID=1330072 RepID=A0A4S8F0B5_9BURK|nr:MBL fold metallo-hydrolase [Lampropedia puyangensis]THU00317.1 MBL fold metallo-hydrolase [Lampropedia puyangensis]
MIRPDTFLHPSLSPVTPEPAVTLIVVRDREQGGMEVLLSRRSAQARFVPNAYVFPGGRLETDDAALAQQGQFRPAASLNNATLAAAAARECFEELGLLFARDTEGNMVNRTMLEQAHLDRSGPLLAQLHHHGWHLALDGIYPFAHWITDRDYPRRFDVPFLVAHAPSDQIAVADGAEQFDALWLTPAQALEQHAAGHMLLVYPTIRTLEQLALYRSADALLQACQNGPVMPPSCPRVGFSQGQEIRLMEHEPGFGELHLVCPNGEPAHDIAWQHERPVPLLRHIQRLTAPNAGMMTGPGTNTYLIGEPSTGFIVMDPGPIEPQHLQRIMQHTGGDIRHIVCTHSHPDHSPGAAPLQAMVQGCGHAVPGIYGMSSGPFARQDSQFTPDHELRTGDTVQLQGQRANGDSITHTLHALHTPGHAANHLCFVLQEDGLLFSGDHILGGSTTVVIPPDGGMQDFLDSLDQLSLACQRWDISFILPAHGHVLDCAPEVIAQLKAHRLRRETKVLRAIEQAPQGTVEDWLATAYADTPPALWPVARLSLLAHVQRLASLHPALGLQRIPMPEGLAAPH